MSPHGLRLDARKRETMLETLAAVILRPRRLALCSRLLDGPRASRRSTQGFEQAKGDARPVLIDVYASCCSVVQEAANPPSRSRKTRSPVLSSTGQLRATSAVLKTLACIRSPRSSSSRAQRLGRSTGDQIPRHSDPDRKRDAVAGWGSAAFAWQARSSFRIVALPRHSRA